MANPDWKNCTSWRARATRSSNVLLVVSSSLDCSYNIRNTKDRLVAKGRSRAGVIVKTKAKGTNGRGR